MRAALICAALLIASPGAAVAGPVPAEVNGPAASLVALLVPEDGMTDLAAGLIAWRAENDRATGAGTRAQYARYPGLKAHVADRLRKPLAKLLKRELPSLRRDVGAIVAAQMNAREIAQSEQFFASPAGQKVYANALRSIAEKPDRDESQAAQAVLTAAFANVPLRDYPAVLAFSASGAARKITAINPQISTVSRAWADRLIAKNGTKLDKLSRKAAKEFIKKAGQARS